MSTDDRETPRERPVSSPLPPRPRSLMPSNGSLKTIGAVVAVLGLGGGTVLGQTELAGLRTQIEHDRLEVSEQLRNVRADLRELGRDIENSKSARARDMEEIRAAIAALPRGRSAR